MYIFDGILNPLVMMLQGAMTDKLVGQMNRDIMKKSIEIKDLELFESDKFYNDMQIIQEESTWRPVNLLVFSISIFKNIITSISFIIILSRFNIMIALLIIISIVPQSVMLYRLQEEAFENMVTKSPLARKLKYYSSILLSKNYAKEARIFQYGDYFLDKYNDTFNSIHKDSMKIRKKQLIHSSLLFIIGALGSGVSFYWVIVKTIDGVFTAGDILMFSSTIIIAAQTIIVIVKESALLYDTLLFMDKYFNFLNQDIKMISGIKKLKEEGIVKIEFKNVKFTYPGSENPVLNNISFIINANEKIALVGENGSGKSTIIKLITRLYDIDNGEILINDINISEYDIDSYREAIGIVFQDFSKYDLSIKENIAISNIRDIYNIDKIENISFETGIDEIVENFNHGLNQQLGKNFENGMELSGGQWQKLAISRAYFKDASLLLFDEPSSALDARNEEYFFKNLNAFSKGRIVLFVTHGLAIVPMADNIIMLKNGKIVESGNHDKLMKNKSDYFELYSLQSERFTK